MAGASDKATVRDLAKRVHEVAASDGAEAVRERWRRHNSMESREPLVRVFAFAAAEVPEVSELTCSDPELREMERSLRTSLYRAGLGDDSVRNPWFPVRAAFSRPERYDARWGPKISVVRPETERGAFAFDPPLRGGDDLSLLVRPRHVIDEARTAERLERAQDALGGALPAVADRTPFYSGWLSDVSTEMAFLLGLERMMLMMADDPGYVHALAAFLRDSAMGVYDEAEAAGDFSSAEQLNQAEPYSRELPDPTPDPSGNRLSLMWGYCAAQETAAISPAMWEEFILAYQKPIYERFGLLSYGCCEDLTRRIGPLSEALPNLRRIAVTPWADFRSCSEQIGDRYVLSWRPSPTDMVARGCDPAFARKAIREAFKVASANGNYLDVILKDVETVSGDMGAVPGFVRCVREVREEGWL
ncbi:MAG: hypothetical protein FWE70_07040 [Oscillospiraceae bacterium]|nr:hypothetical protein [Oscillospiraceae bacterium]